MCVKKMRAKKRWFELGLTRCSYCCVQLNWMHGHKNSATVEHIIPKKLGGTLRFDNTLIVCHTCNQKRWHKNFAAYVTGSRMPRLNWLLTKYKNAVNHMKSKGKDYGLYEEE